MCLLIRYLHFGTYIIRKIIKFKVAWSLAVYNSLVAIFGGGGGGGGGGGRRPHTTTTNTANKIGSTQSAASAGAGLHNDFETISDAQEALWLVRENFDKASCPKKKRINDQQKQQQAGGRSSSGSGSGGGGGGGGDRTYTKYPSEVDLYQYRHRQQYQSGGGGGGGAEEAFYSNGRSPSAGSGGVSGGASGGGGGSTLRRSRSLAVTREDIYTDLNLQTGGGASRTRRSQLIPRARLIDKGSFKERATYQHLDRCSKRSSCGSIDRLHGTTPPPGAPPPTQPAPGSRAASVHSEHIPIPQKLEKVTAVLTSWPDAHDIIRSYPQFKRCSSDEYDQQQHQHQHHQQQQQQDQRQQSLPPTSLNPSEIDSLESNFQNKSTCYSTENNQYDDSDDLYQLQQHQQNQQRSKFAYYDDTEYHQKYTTNHLGLSLPNYYPDSIYDTDLSLSHGNNSILDIHTDITDVPQKQIFIEDNPHQLEFALNAYESAGEKEANIEELEISARLYDDRNKSDSITFPDNSADIYTQEYHFRSDEYKPSEDNIIAAETTTFVEIPLRQTDEAPKPSENIIYTQLDFKPKVVASDCKQKSTPVREATTYDQLQPQKPAKTEQPSSSKVKNFLNKNFISVFSDTVTRRKSDANKLISTEPYVTTFLENQYYSLPDVTISKSLRKCARIDAKLRQIDQITAQKNADLQKCIPTNNNNNRFVVNIGQHFASNQDERDADELDRDKEVEEIKVNNSVDGNKLKILSKPIEISRKCKITTDAVDKNQSLDIKLETYTDEINLRSSSLDNPVTESRGSIKVVIKNQVKPEQRSNEVTFPSLKVLKPKKITNTKTKITYNTKPLSEYGKQSLKGDAPRSSGSKKTISLNINEGGGGSVGDTVPPPTHNSPSKSFTKARAMPRPQIIHVVDAKQAVAAAGNASVPETSVAAKQQREGTSSTSTTTCASDLGVVAAGVANCEQEYEEKLNSVKHYWDKLLDKSVEEEAKRHASADPNNIKVVHETLKRTITTTTTTSENGNLPKITEGIPKKTHTQPPINGNTSLRVINEIPKDKVIEESTWGNEHDKSTELPCIKIEHVRKIFEPSVEAEEHIVEEPPSQVEIARKIFEPPPEPQPEDQTKMGAFVKESCSFFEKAYGTLKKSFGQGNKTRPADGESCTDDSLVTEEESSSTGNESDVKAKRSDSVRNESLEKIRKHLILRKAKSFDENDEQDFDHIRYKVMKSNVFQKSLFGNYKKEAQFDGLMQYLQDYSFQELLINNNVVIIEPVRTKIERDSKGPLQQTKPKNGRLLPNRKISIVNSSSGGEAKSKKTMGGLRKHFFYHPIRVNRELIEEELPDPETVRKVRTFFEKELAETKLTKSQSSKNLADTKAVKPRKRILRYLTVDTNFGKWDSGSLSSGVSSGGSISDFDSPKMPNNENLFSSEENVCEATNEEYYDASVSQDVMKKIRECGTTITYYGGKVLDSQSGPVLSPMTKSIMEEIKHINGRPANGTPQVNGKNVDNKTRNIEAVATPKETYQGIKFKLVKSNSCSSRLELVGAEKPESLAQKFFNQKRKSCTDVKILKDLENLKQRNESNNNNSHHSPEFVKKGKSTSTMMVAPPPTEAKNEEIIKNDGALVDKPLTKWSNFASDQQRPPATAANGHKLQPNYERQFEFRTYQDNTANLGPKFGEMVFEEFEVAECYDSLNSRHEDAK